MKYEQANFTRLNNAKKRAIEQAEENCNHLKFLIEHGVPTVDDRIPSFTTSILGMPSSTGMSVSKPNKVTLAVTEEINDYKFITKMENIISNLKQPYKEIFTDAFINLIPIKNLYNGRHGKLPNENIYKILKKGYLEIALLDADINFSYIEFMNLKKQEFNTKKHKSIIKSNVKAMLDEILSYKISQKLIYDEYLNTIDFDLAYETSYKINSLFEIIKQLPAIEKACIINYLLEKNDNTKNSSYYRNFERAALTIALMDPSIDYNFSQFKHDMQDVQGKRFESYVSKLNIHQITLNI